MTIAVLIIGVVWMQLAAEILLMQTAMGSVIIMQPARAEAMAMALRADAAGIMRIRTETVSVIIIRLASARAEETDVVQADVETVPGADVADKKRNYYAERTRDDQSYRTVF